MESRRYRKIGIVLSGGVGSRMQSNIPKQYIEVERQPIIGYTLKKLYSWKNMEALVVIADKEWRALINRYLPLKEEADFLGYADPGSNRQYSILNALHLLKDKVTEDAVVMIHDAVRPLVSEELLFCCDSLLDSAEWKEYDGIMPYLRVKDTIYESKDGKCITSLLDREKLFAGQTPEYYDYHKYLEAVERLTPAEMQDIHGSTEPAVMAGLRMLLVHGEERNIKITTRQDLERFREYISGEEE